MTSVSPWFDVDSKPTVGGLAVTDLSAVFGGMLWVGIVLTGSLSQIERALTLAPLVLVPLGLRMIAVPPFSGRTGWLYTTAVVLQPVGAVCVLWSFLVSTASIAAGLSTVWLIVCGVLAGVGLQRTVDRGSIAPLSETVIDAGLAYIVVGAVALMLHHLGISFWFDPVIILLTAVHFHYAGFVLPVMAGLTGRTVDSPNKIYQVVTSVILIGPAIIAVGISFSALIEFLAVSVYTLTVTVFGGYVIVRVAPNRQRLQGTFLVASALALPVSMALALAYVSMLFVGFDPISINIPRMVQLHGTLNAFGFGLVGLVGWRVEPPCQGEPSATV